MLMRGEVLGMDKYTPQNIAIFCFQNTLMKCRRACYYLSILTLLSFGELLQHPLTHKNACLLQRPHLEVPKTSPLGSQTKPTSRMMFQCRRLVIVGGKRGESKTPLFSSSPKSTSSCVGVSWNPGGAFNSGCSPALAWNCQKRRYSRKRRVWMAFPDILTSCGSCRILRGVTGDNDSTALVRA